MRGIFASAGEQSRRSEGSSHYARAVLLMAGRAAGVSLLNEAGVPLPPEALPPSDARSPALDGSAADAAGEAESVPPSVDASELEALDDSERTHEEQLLRFLSDSGVGPSPAAAMSQLCAEALNMLAINLDGSGLFRASQVLFIHAIRVRRALLGRAHYDTAAT